MASPVMVPKDIITRIIGHFSDDDFDTLEECSVVSHAFSVPSQKRLFSIVHIGPGRKLCRRLYRLLTRSPHIASYIRELHVVDRVRDGKGWVPIYEAFPRLLQTVTPYLQSFSLSFREYAGVEWDRLPADLQSSLLDLFRSSRLVSIKVSHIHGSNFPMSVLRTLCQLRKLGFLARSSPDATLGDGFQPTLPPELRPKPGASKKQLESLELGGDMSAQVVACLMHPDSLLGITELREVSIHDAEKLGMLDTVWEIIQRSAPTIESFIWNDPVLEPEGKLFRSLHSPSIAHACPFSTKRGQSIPTSGPESHPQSSLPWVSCLRR